MMAFSKDIKEGVHRACSIIRTIAPNRAGALVVQKARHVPLGTFSSIPAQARGKGRSYCKSAAHCIASHLRLKFALHSASTTNQPTNQPNNQTTKQPASVISDRSPAFCVSQPYCNTTTATTPSPSYTRPKSIQPRHLKLLLDIILVGDNASRSLCPG